MSIASGLASVLGAGAEAYRKTDKELKEQARQDAILRMQEEQFARQKSEWAREDKMRADAEGLMKPAEIVTGLGDSESDIAGGGLYGVSAQPGKTYGSQMEAQKALETYNAGANKRLAEYYKSQGDLPKAAAALGLESSQLNINEAQRRASMEARADAFDAALVKEKNLTTDKINQLAAEHGISYGHMLDMASKKFGYDAAELSNRMVTRQGLLTDAFSKGGVNGLVRAFNEHPEFGDGAQASIEKGPKGKLTLSVYGQKITGTPDEIFEKAATWATNPLAAGKLSRDIETHNADISLKAAHEAAYRRLGAGTGSAAKNAPIGFVGNDMIVPDGKGGFKTQPIMVNGKPATPEQIRFFKRSFSAEPEDPVIAGLNKQFADGKIPVSDYFAELRKYAASKGDFNLNDTDPEKDKKKKPGLTPQQKAEQARAEYEAMNPTSLMGQAGQLAGGYMGTQRDAAMFLPEGVWNQVLAPTGRALMQFGRAATKAF